MKKIYACMCLEDLVELDDLSIYSNTRNHVSFINFLNVCLFVFFFDNIYSSSLLLCKEMSDVFRCINYPLSILYLSLGSLISIERECFMKFLNNERKKYCEQVRNVLGFERCLD